MKTKQETGRREVAKLDDIAEILYDRCGSIPYGNALLAAFNSEASYTLRSSLVYNGDSDCSWTVSSESNETRKIILTLKSGQRGDVTYITLEAWHRDHDLEDKPIFEITAVAGVSKVALFFDREKTGYIKNWVSVDTHFMSFNLPNQEANCFARVYGIVVSRTKEISPNLSLTAR